MKTVVKNIKIRRCHIVVSSTIIVLFIFNACVYKQKNDYSVYDINSDCTEFYHVVLAKDNTGKGYIILSKKNTNTNGNKIVEGSHYPFLLHKMTDTLLEKEPLLYGDSAILVGGHFQTYISCDTLKISPWHNDLYFADNLNDLYIE